MPEVLSVCPCGPIRLALTPNTAGGLVGGRRGETHTINNIFSSRVIHEGDNTTTDSVERKEWLADYDALWSATRLK